MRSVRAIIVIVAVACGGSTGFVTSSNLVDASIEAEAQAPPSVSPYLSCLDGGAVDSAAPPCTQPQSDPRNCGTCGVDCGGDDCVLGQCVALAADVLSSGQRWPMAIAVDDAFVYWANLGDGHGGGKIAPSFTDGQILRCAITGCDNQPTVLGVNDGWGGIYGDLALAIDAFNVYWNGSSPCGGEGIVACAKSGCDLAPTLLAPQGAESIALSANSVVWSTGYDGIFSCAKTGCGLVATALDTSMDPLPGIAADDAHAYWTSLGGNVDTCNISSCTTSAIAMGQASADQIAVDETNIYWTASNPSSQGGVYQCKKTGCDIPTTLAANRSAPFGIAIDATNVYWTEGTQILRCAIGGCNNKPTVVALANSAVGIAVGANRVFWTELATSANTSGRVRSAAK